MKTAQKARSLASVLVLVSLIVSCAGAPKPGAASARNEAAEAAKAAVTAPAK